MAPKYYKLGSILKRLLFDNNMKAVDLAREVNIPAPTIHRLITGKSTRPYKSSLIPIADYFSVKIEQLLGEEPLQPDNVDKTSVIDKTNIHHIPLLIWDDLHLVCSETALSDEKLPFLGEISNNGFATIMHDSSMEPVFARDSLLIFDPQKLPKDRSYVLIQLHDSKQFLFRQLLIDADQQYLKPLTPDLNAFKMRLLTSKDKIIATLLEARHVY